MLDQNKPKKPKRESILQQSAWVASENLERIYSLREICTAGVLVMASMSSEEREGWIAKARAKDIPTTTGRTSSAKVKLPKGHSNEEQAALEQVFNKDAKKDGNSTKPKRSSGR